MKKLIISAVNLVEGGTLTILHNCLQYLNSTPEIYNHFEIIVLVHKKDIFSYEYITFIEFPISKKNWLFRTYYEYIYFRVLSYKWSPFLWFSLHDITPAVKATRRAVYCHNPTPFYTPKIKDFKYSIKIILFSAFYKHLYKINIKNNSYVIVQQEWIRSAFAQMFHIDITKIIVAYPKETSQLVSFTGNDSNVTVFVYPALPRPFKNFQIICQAAELLIQQGITNFKVILTIDGSENNYSREIITKYGNISNINYCGKLKYPEVQTLYASSTCLIFPSLLETWGLPISEYVPFKKPIMAADLPYAHETASGATLVAFFDPHNANTLALLMKNVIDQDLSKFSECQHKKIEMPHTKSWKEIFDILLAE